MNVEQLKDALVKAHEAGDEEAAQLFASEIKALRPTAPPKSDDQKRAEIGGGRLEIANPLAMLGIGKSRYDLGVNTSQQVSEGLAGFGRRISDIATFGNRGTKDENADKLLDGSGYATAGGIAADVGSLAVGGGALKAAGGAVKGGQALRTVGQNMIAPTSVMNAALVGGAYNAATTNGDIKDRAIAGGFGLGAGALGQAAPMAIGAMLKPRVADDVANLVSRGIRMTPGQIMGGRANTLEQKLMSVPFVGGGIRAGRQQSIEDMNRAVANEVLAPLGVKAKDLPVGRDLVEGTQKVVANVYEDVLPRITSSFDDGLNQSIDKGRAIAAESGFEGRFDAILKNRLFPKLTGQAFKDADSALGAAARKARSKEDYDLADALEIVKDGLRKSAKGDSKDLVKLKQADAAYARLVRLETAAAMRGAKDGIFTPAQFGNAVEKGASRKTKAAGKELMGKFADDAERRLSTSFPNSGTADRILAGGMALGGGYALNQDPMHAIPMGAAALAFTPWGRAMARNAMTKRPNWKALEHGAQGARRLAPMGGLLAPQLLSPALLPSIGE
jgi:ketosteroid isomerase-like protein